MNFYCPHNNLVPYPLFMSKNERDFKIGPKPKNVGQINYFTTSE